MSKVLITGGRGRLGRIIAPLLTDKGHTVRIMSRSAAKSDSPYEWAQADLETGEGLREAVAGTEVIIHSASNFVKSSQSDVEGTKRLLQLASEEGVKHLLYISIVGIEKFPKFSYYKSKLLAEQAIKSTNVPYTILRATQFHYFIDILLGLQRRSPVMLLPTNWQFQLIDPDEVAARMVELVEAGASGHVADIGGPEVLSLGELVKAWKAAQGIHRLVIPMPQFGETARGYRNGFNTCPDQKYGKITWAEWLQRKYGAKQANTLTPQQVRS
jgi:uncharacterized protein YbjT (DUF2867 family)